MSEILCYMPTYSPKVEADNKFPRALTRLPQDQIVRRLGTPEGKAKPWIYMDAVDSILNVRPDIKLVVGDGRSTQSIRDIMGSHNAASGGYHIENYPECLSQWIIFNDIMEKHSTPDTKYFVYTSSDVIWTMDWVAEAIKEFENNPHYMILFPCVNNGDKNLPCQIAQGPRDLPPFKPPYQQEAKAPVINAYAMIFRMSFLRAYGGYPTLFRNCFTESFLHYMCEAVGGEQRVLPRGWVYHYGTIDIWEENGSFYHYNEEKLPFMDIMTKIQMARGFGKLAPEYLKKMLWR